MLVVLQVLDAILRAARREMDRGPDDCKPDL